MVPPHPALPPTSTRFPFSALPVCGHVTSARALDHMPDVCPVCQADYVHADLVPVNGTEEQVEQLRARLAGRGGGGGGGPERKKKRQRGAATTASAASSLQPAVGAPASPRQPAVGKCGSLLQPAIGGGGSSLLSLTGAREGGAVAGQGKGAALARSR